MKKGKSNFFLIAPFALWGCISVWTSNLVRLTDKSAVPYAWAFNFVLDSSCCSSYSMKESKVITQSSVRSQYFLFQQYSSSFSICMVHIYLPRSIHLKGKI